MSGHSSFNWYVGANATATPNLRLAPTGLSVSGAAVSSDKRLTFHDKPLIHAVQGIHKLEPAEYDKNIQPSRSIYNTDTASLSMRLHSTSGSIIEELKASVIGCEICED